MVLSGASWKLIPVDNKQMETHPFLQVKNGSEQELQIGYLGKYPPYVGDHISNN
jgi:hypothetical protein